MIDTQLGYHKLTPTQSQKDTHITHFNEKLE